MKAILVLLVCISSGAFSQAPKKYLAEHYPLLDSIAEADLIKDDHKAVNEYAFKITERSWIESEQDIRSVLETRDEEIAPIISNLLMSMDEEKFRDVGWNLEGELDSLGMTIITAEGFFGAVGRGHVLEDELLQFAGEEYHLWVNITVTQDETQGGEYPYLDVSAETEVVAQCEEFLQRFPENEFSSEALNYLRSALEVLTDIHKVTSEDYEHYCYSGAEIESWPYETEIESAMAFVETHPESRFAGVIDSILKNPSVIGPDDQNIFLVVTDWTPDIDGARDLTWSYLSSGRDIPHILQVERLDGSIKYAVGYRFFSDYNLALDANEKMQARAMATELVELTNLHDWGNPAQEVR